MKFLKTCKAVSNHNPYSVRGARLFSEFDDHTKMKMIRVLYSNIFGSDKGRNGKNLKLKIMKKRINRENKKWSIK